MSNPYDSYRKVQFETADPGQLPLMLYQGAVRSLDRAETALMRGDLVASNKEIIRTQNVLLELLGSLDYSHGEIPQTLSELYTYLYQALIEANVRKDIVTLRRVRGIVSRLCEAWESVVNAARGNVVPTSGVEVRVYTGHRGLSDVRAAS